MAALAALLAAAPAAGAQTQTQRPALVVFITVDQLRPDYFDRYAGELTGGLARLSRGAFFTDAYQDHAITETAPGHASTLSAAFPPGRGSWPTRTVWAIPRRRSSRGRWGAPRPSASAAGC